MATLVQSVTVLHPSDNNANTSAASDLGPTRDYERASPLRPVQPASSHYNALERGGIGEILY